MDLAYDHILEQSLTPDQASKTQKEKQPETSLNGEFQEAYKAISTSAWGSKLGGFFGTVVKQGETVYKEAQQELSAVSEEATRGFTDLRSSIINRTRGMSLVGTVGAVTPRSAPAAAAVPAAEGSGAGDDKEAAGEAGKDGEGVLAQLRVEATKRLKQINEAEDAADEALLKFGTNIRNFLRDAVTIAPPSGDSGSNTVLFESKDAQGKRVIHSTRFDAQMHVIHTSLDSFTKDPESEEFEPWTKTFDAEAKTDTIAKDLDNFSELRTSMEKLVPDTVAYADFWKRYYFLRHSIETAEARRRDLLKGAAASAEQEEEVAWDEDSEEDSAKTPKLNPVSEDKIKDLSESVGTIHPITHLKPTDSRKSDENSRADSDASYDVIGAASGAPSSAPSHAPGSPKETVKKQEESDEEEDEEEGSSDEEESSEEEDSEEEDWE